MDNINFVSEKELYHGIRIVNQGAEMTEIDIEGTIGIPEQEQFELPEKKVATYDKFKIALEAISRVNTPRIIINIRSTGGNVNDALLIYDAIRSIRAEVTTRCFGYVASAATIIAQAASPGRREMSANALYLIHKSNSSAEGNADEMNRTASLLNKTDERIASIYATRSGRSKDFFIDLMNENNGNGRWLSAQEAVEAALVDTITGVVPIRNDASAIVAQFGLPELPEKSNEISMNFRNRWNAIAARLGLGPSGTSKKTTHSTMAAVEDAQCVGAADENSPIPVDASNETPAAQRPIPKETELMRARVLPTMTKRREDPSTTEYQRPANERAYAEDIKQFK